MDMLLRMRSVVDFKEFDGGYVTFGGGAHDGRISGKGTLKTNSLDFEDVYFFNELNFNLFSVSQMCDKNTYVLFTDTECLVLSPNFKLLNESQILLKIPRKDNMYSFDIKNIVPKENLTYLVAKATSDESMLWHRRLGHINFKNINKLVKDNLVRGLPTKHFENDQTCVACLKGKQHRASCKSKVLNPITKPLFMLHMDLFGPTFVSSLMHKKYCLVVTDDYSRFTWVFFLTTKDETSEILKNFIKEIENLVDKKVKIIRSDNGTEFKNKVMDDFCIVKGSQSMSDSVRIRGSHTQRCVHHMRPHLSRLRPALQEPDAGTFRRYVSGKSMLIMRLLLRISQVLRMLTTAHSPDMYQETDLLRQIQRWLDDEDPEEDNDMDIEANEEDEDDEMDVEIDEEAEEEHPAPAYPVVVALPATAPSAEETEPFETELPVPAWSDSEVARLLAISSPPASPLSPWSSSPPQIPSPLPPSIPSPPLPLSPPSPVLSAPPPSPIRSLGYRAVMIRMRAEGLAATSILTITPPLISPTRPVAPPPIPTSAVLSFITHHCYLPSASRREDRPEVNLPSRKRLGITLGPRYEVGESSAAAAARPTGGLREDYGFATTMDKEIRRDPERYVGYRIIDSWDEIVQTL
ncbi:putative ribonuclease H-like domain-containing protein [Tanacetum coccineum]